MTVLEIEDVTKESRGWRTPPRKGVALDGAPRAAWL